MDQELITYLDRRFEDIDRRFEDIDRRFDGIDGRFEGTNERFDEFENQLRETHVLIEGLDSKIETVAEGVLSNGEAHRRLRVELGRRFEEVRAVNRVPYAGLERRMVDHDRRLESLEGRVDGLEAE